MKATGIVRRIDDLGRVVIPKEIRRTMRIREGVLTLIMLVWYKALVELGKERGKGSAPYTKRGEFAKNENINQSA